ncbi:uncharacterized protein LOC143049927 [Mytilus galloprovincialis]|uniref:uncharacterized protein LOC143049927 n=1 Tax=Mytilus galloprovincialis TaxID=29158 RepID=UPI003F7C9B66
MKPPKRPRNVPKKVSQQPAGPAKKSRKGKVPSTRGALSKSQNTTRTVQVSRAATDSNLAIARCAAINIVSDAHQEPPFVPFRIQDEMDTESPNGNEGDALDRPRGDLLPLTPQPGPSGVMSPANNNLGMLTVSNVSHGSAAGSLDTRLQVDQSPSYISSVFDPISSHIPVKIKEKIWNGEFIDLNVLLKSTRDLVNEQNLEGELVVKGGVLSLVNQKKSPIKSIYVWTSAFMIYGSVVLEKWPNKGLEFFKYMQTVRMAASRGYSGGWVHYDEQFRLRKVFPPFLHGELSIWSCGYYVYLLRTLVLLLTQEFQMAITINRIVGIHRQVGRRVKM